MDQIGRAGYFWLVQTQAKIEKHWKEFTFNMLRIITGPEYNRPGTCEYAFTSYPLSRLSDIGTGLNVMREDTFVDEAVAALMALQTDEPIRAALRSAIVQSRIRISFLSQISILHATVISMHSILLYYVYIAFSTHWTIACKRLHLIPSSNTIHTLS
ncbi:hypothetical protein B0H11DRAFT_1934709 [Mycena galericulata]|nr:hypothetical protein B0H11DRAFT_1934709 [Mycena galericulata]